MCFSPGRGWCDVAGRGDGHQWLEHRRRADQHPGGACRPSHGGQVQTKWYLGIINIMLNKNTNKKNKSILTWLSIWPPGAQRAPVFWAATFLSINCNFQIFEHAMWSSSNIRKSNMEFASSLKTKVIFINGRIVCLQCSSPLTIPRTVKQFFFAKYFVPLVIPDRTWNLSKVKSLENSTFAQEKAFFVPRNLSDLGYPGQSNLHSKIIYAS